MNQQDIAVRLGVSDFSSYFFLLHSSSDERPPQLPGREDGVGGSPVLAAALIVSAGVSSLRRLLDRQRRFPSQHQTQSSKQHHFAAHYRQTWCIILKWKPMGTLEEQQRSTAQWVAGELVPISSSLWPRGRVHPGQVASPSQGNTQTTMHTLIHTPKGNLE
ncbi:hypothetical protein ILYODFUR_036893 [Ilyodon furcidens]|uniref:Uncharacterized protein n=1 Tax=Ilyodon furcidens TaxID=33524 RepID=A0ABV0SSL7_9TELE